MYHYLLIILLALSSCNGEEIPEPEDIRILFDLVSTRSEESFFFGSESKLSVDSIHFYSPIVGSSNIIVHPEGYFELAGLYPESRDYGFTVTYNEDTLGVLTLSFDPNIITEYDYANINPGSILVFNGSMICSNCSIKDVYRIPITH